MNHLSQTSTLPMLTSDGAREAEKSAWIRPAGSNLLKSVVRATSWIWDKTRKQQMRKILKVSESVSLGEKRFVAVVQVAHERFLIGGAATSVSMLARLEPNAFAEALRQSQEAGQS